MPFLGLTVNWSARGPAAERLADLARRCGDLTPLREPVRQILVDGNRERSLAGTDPQGRSFAALAASTLRRRRGTGPPLAPRGAQSRVVTAYEVDVLAGAGRLSFTGSWPSLPWMEYHHSGTARMPARNPYGFRQQDLDEVRALLVRHVVRGVDADR
jgi:hypothetical protein